MIIKKRKFKGVFEITLSPHLDKRGFFMRTYDEKIFKKYRLHRRWVQENQSLSKHKGTIRGLHFQLPPHGEIKLVRVATGKVWLVFVDLRKASDTFAQWDKIILSVENKKMLYLPKGFALGMCALTKSCTLLYKMGDYYVPESQGIIKWNDADLAIDWPSKKPILSEKDLKAPSFKEFKEKYGSLEE